jgi:bacterioferritin
MAKASEQLIAGLNQALSEELTALIQYLWHHIQGRGIESAAVSEIFKATSMTEMNHAYKLAERIDLLGGVPGTAGARPPKVGGDLRQMIQDDLAGEYAAIEMYKRLVDLADDEDDDVTEQMLIGILKDEQEHANQWETVLGQ